MTRFLIQLKFELYFHGVRIAALTLLLYQYFLTLIDIGHTCRESLVLPQPPPPNPAFAEPFATRKLPP
jgi:hypothetical protein